MATAHDVDILARTVYGEARSESWQGKQAVAFVVKNRADKSGRTLAQECQKKWQFSAWNEGDPNRDKLLSVTMDNRVYQECLAAALTVICGKAGADPTEGSRHYHTAGVTPSWSRGKVPVCQIGGHFFFNDIQ